MLGRIIFIERRTLSTVITTLRVGFVSAIRAHIVKLQCGPELRRLQDEGLPERFPMRVGNVWHPYSSTVPLPLAFTFLFPLFALELCLVITLPEALFEECSN